MTLRRGLCRFALLLAAGLVSGGCDGAEADPCRDVACSDHGRCVSNSTVPACVCDPGYHPVGLACEPDHGADGDGDGDADVGPTDGGDDGGDGDAEGLLHTGPGPLTFVITETEFLTTRLFDFDGDGDLDNAVADLGSPADVTFAAVLTQGVGIPIGHGWRQCMRIPGVDDRAAPEAASTTFINFSCLDVDDPPNIDDDFSGAEPFHAEPSSLDACGEPRSYIEGLRMEEGSVAAGPGVLESITYGMAAPGHRCRVIGTISPGGASCDILVSGVILPHDMGDEPGINETGDLTFLEMALAVGIAMGIPAFTGITPDVDIDGDGLERFEIDDEGHILRCIDGDWTVIEGSDCWRDERMADGFSLTARFTGVSATFAGPIPGWQSEVPGTCESPPEQSLWGSD